MMEKKSKKMRKEFAERIEQMFEELQEMAEKIGPIDEDASDRIAICQSELESCASDLTEN